jgi:hypothetical protein
VIAIRLQPSATAQIQTRRTKLRAGETAAQAAVRVVNRAWGGPRSRYTVLRSGVCTDTGWVRGEVQHTLEGWNAGTVWWPATNGEKALYNA